MTMLTRLFRTAQDEWNDACQASDGLTSADLARADLRHAFPDAPSPRALSDRPAKEGPGGDYHDEWRFP